MKRSNGVFAALLLLTTTLACALPTLQQPASSPLPTPDTRLDTMVAEMVSTALAETQQVVPVVTSIPPTSTPRSTVTAAPTATTSAESTLDKNEDGSSTFVDLLGKYQLTTPANWLALRINAPEYLQAGLSPEAANPAIQRSLDAMKNLDPKIFRLFVLDTNEDQMDGGFVTNINLVWDQQTELSFANDTDLKSLAASLPNSVKGATVQSTELKSTKSGIPFGVITATTPILTQDGANVVMFQELVYFDLPVGTLSITLSTTDKLQATIGPLFDDMIESFTLMQ